MYDTSVHKNRQLRCLLSVHGTSGKVLRHKVTLKKLDSRNLLTWTKIRLRVRIHSSSTWPPQRVALFLSSDSRLCNSVASCTSWHLTVRELMLQGLCTYTETTVFFDQGICTTTDTWRGRCVAVSCTKNRISAGTCRSCSAWTTRGSAGWPRTIPRGRPRRPRRWASTGARETARPRWSTEPRDTSSTGTLHTGRFGPIHSQRKSDQKRKIWKNTEKRSKKYCQTSKKIFTFAFHWCEWALKINLHLPLVDLLTH